MGRGRFLTFVLVICLALSSCGEEDGSQVTPPATGGPVEAEGIEADSVGEAAVEAVALLGDRAPEAVWELFAEGSGADEVIAAIEDGSIVDEVGSASTIRFASVTLAALDATAEAEFDAFLTALEAELEADAAAAEDLRSVMAQLVLHGQGYTNEQIAEAAEAGNLVLSAQDPFHCYWTSIEGLPAGSGFTIPGVTPAGPNLFAGQDCPEVEAGIEDDQETEADPGSGDPEAVIEVVPPAGGSQASLDCDSLDPPGGVEAEVNVESSAADPDESGFARDVRCNFFLANADGARAGIAINVQYYCDTEATDTIDSLGDVSGRTRIAADTYRDVETSDSPIQSNAGEFFTQDKLFSKVGTYAVTTIVLNRDEGFESTEFLEMAFQLAAQMHPPVAGALDYC